MLQLNTLFAVMLLCLVWQVAPAQDHLERRPPPLPAYTLGPGDSLVLRVDDVEEITDRAFRIDPSGFVDVPLAGRVQAAGLTLEEFKASLAGSLSKFVTKPQISANLTDSASQPVSIVGAVNSPGVHQLGNSKRLLDVISLSGGLRADAGPKVIVTRDPRQGKIPGQNRALNDSGYRTASFSLDDLLAAKNPEENIEIRPNDLITVPRADFVYVLGNVRKAGGFALTTHPSVSLLQALSLAEGLSPDNSAKNARILRQLPGGDGTPREIPVDIPKIYAGKAPDVALLPNDVLFVPHSGIKVTSRRAAEAAIGITTGLLIYR